MRLFGLIFGLIFLSPIFGQVNPWHPEEDTLPHQKNTFWHSPENFAKSISVLGGYESKGFTAGMMKFAYGKNHWSGNLGIFYQQHRVNWDSIETATSSSGKYSLSGFSISGRYYTGKICRGGFLEIGAGSAFPRLAVLYKNDNSIKKDGWKFQFIEAGGGYRLGKKPKGLFAELSYRTWTTVHKIPVLRTDINFIPITDTRAPSILYHTWWLKRWRFQHQVWLGIGYSF